jgi:hypothetical protein
MSYLSDLESANESMGTLLHIHIGGKYASEMEELLDCLVLDTKREFRLVGLKRQPNLISALVSMELKDEFKQIEKRSNSF